MSRRALAVLPLLALGLVAVQPTTADAQTSDAGTADARTTQLQESRLLSPELREVEARLIAEIDRIIPALQAASARAAEIERAKNAANEPPQVATDTIQVRGLTVIAPTDEIAEAEMAFERALAEYGQWIGGLAFERPFVYQRRRGAVRLGLEGELHYMLIDEDEEAHPWTRVREALAHEVGTTLRGMLRSWMSQQPLDARPEQAAAIYRSMVYSGSRSVHRCAGGDAEACWTSLGLGSSEDPMSEWYALENIEFDPDLDWAGARRQGWDFPQYGLYSWMRCRAADRPAESCFSEVDWLGAIPLSPAARSHFLAFSLRQGGEGALERFAAEWRASDYDTRALREARLEDPKGAAYLRERAAYEAHLAMSRSPAVLGKEIRSRLVRATGIDEDALMAAWMEEVTGEEITRADMLTDQGRWVALFWIALMIAFAMRSTRWRLG